jgi:hypothetical protein
MRGKLRFILFDAMSLISDNFGTHRRLAMIQLDDLFHRGCADADAAGVFIVERERLSSFEIVFQV